jgi:hypothetical protein
MAGKKLVAVGASLAVCGVVLLPATQSYAHSGPDAIALIRSFALTPAPQGWTASLTIVDSDSGTALPAVDVKLRGAGAPKLTSMVESTTDGTYTLALPKAKPGPTELHLQLRELPGGTDVLDFTESWTGTLEAGKPWLVVGSAPATGSGEGSATGPLAAGAGVLLLAGVGTALVLRRRRTGAPQPG